MEAAGVDLATLGELKMDTYYTDPLSLNVMTAIVKNLTDNLGLTVKPLQMSDGAAWQKLYYTDGESHVSFRGAANGPTGDRGYNYFHSSAAYPGGQQRLEGLLRTATRTVDQLLDGRPRSSSTRPSRTRSTSRSARSPRTSCPALYLWQTVRFHVVSKKVRNIILIPAAGGGSYYDAVETLDRQRVTLAQTLSSMRGRSRCSAPSTFREPESRTADGHLHHPRVC